MRVTWSVLITAAILFPIEVEHPPFRVFFSSVISIDIRFSSVSFFKQHYFCLILSEKSKRWEAFDQPVEIEEFTDIVAALGTGGMTFIDGDRTYVIMDEVLGEGANGIIFKGKTTAIH